MDFTPQQKYSLLSKMGYTGSMQGDEMDAFLQSNPGAAAKMGKFDRAMKRGFQTGGVVQGGIQSPTGFTSPTSGAREELASSIGTLGTVEQMAVPKPEDPGQWQWIHNEVQNWWWGSQQRGVIKNNKTGEVQYTNWKSGSDVKEQVRQEAQPLVEQLNAPYRQYQEDLKKYNEYEKQRKAQNLPTTEEAQQSFTQAQENLQLAQAQQAALTPSAREVTTQAITDPTSLVTQAQPSQMVATPDQMVSEDVGTISGQAPQITTTTVDSVAQATTPTATPAATMQASTAAPQVGQVVGGMQAVQGQITPQSLVQAAQQTESSVSQLQAAQGQAFMMENPVQREIQQGELISGSAVDATKVAKINSQLQAAQATPSEKATVQGQLESLMQDFEGGETPAWAAGAMRNAQSVLAQRGLGASSIAGQAVIQATMEAALPIAQADAQTRAQFESQNLSNRQQVAMFAAQQRASFLQQEFDQEFQSRVQNAARVADIANMNFTAEQQIALENSRIANTMNLQNLSNRQAMVMAEASALANLDTANLNNRQQAAVQNAQNFLQMDLANLDRQQQTAIFKSQQRVNALLSDQAAENAAEQFNAASENQTNQFFADLASTTSRFNADQSNAIAQFNAGQENATEQFNASLQEQRDQFNANNRLVVAQANAKWRQDIATLNTAAQNEAIMEAAKTANGLTTTAMDEIWQRERDLMNFSFQTAENSQDRYTELLIADKRFETEQILQAQELSAADKAGKGAIFGSITGELVGGLVDSIF